MSDIGNAIYDLCLNRITEDEFKEFIDSCPAWEMRSYIRINASLQKDRAAQIDALIEKHGVEHFARYYSQDFVHFAAGGIRT